MKQQQIDEAAHFVEPFFKLTEKGIFDKFIKLDRNGTYYNNGDFSFLYIEGTRPDKVLMIAHVDTVWKDCEKLNPIYHEGLFSSQNRQTGVTKSGKPYVAGIGIGADDRAGVALLWRLKDLGHSLLLVSGEENNCLGSSALMSMETAPEIMNDHQFMIEFDRRGRNDLVFYNVGSEKFVEYCVGKTNYKPANGSWTDVCVLATNICALNISVGYTGEHTPNEILNMRWWLRTALTVENWLSKPNLPKFIQD